MSRIEFEESSPQSDKHILLDTESHLVSESTINPAFSNEGSDSLDSQSLYFQDINKMSIVSHEENVKRAQERDRCEAVYGKDSIEYREAVNRLAESHWRLGAWVASKNRNRCSVGLEFLDLIQAGNEGIIRAAETYDPDSGFSFTTYAYNGASRRINREIANHGRTIRVPVYQQYAQYQIRKAKDALAMESGVETPSDEDVAAYLEISLENLRNREQGFHSVISLHASVNDESNREMQDLIVDPSQEFEEDLADKLTVRRILDEAVQNGYIAERDALIVSLRFGLNNGDNMTLEEVGQEMGITRERVRQIESKAINKLRTMVSAGLQRDSKEEEILYPDFHEQQQFGDDEESSENTLLNSNIKDEDQADDTSELSGRELEVLQLLAQGMTNKQIAAIVHLAPSTVKNFNSNIFKKLKVRTRRHAISRGIKLGILDSVTSSTSIDYNSFRLLSKRDREIIEFVSRNPDATNAEIALGLYITNQSVNNHISSILRKMGAKNMTQVWMAYINCKGNEKEDHVLETQNLLKKQNESIPLLENEPSLVIQSDLK